MKKTKKSSKYDGHLTLQETRGNMERTSIRWMTNACFEVQSDGVLLVSDPCLLQTSFKGFKEPFFEKVDGIMLSHLHWDHTTELKFLVNKFNPAVFTGAAGSLQLAEYLDMNTSYLFPMYPDQELDMGEYRIKAFYNRHSDVKMNYSAQAKQCSSYDFYSSYPGLEKLQTAGGMEMYSYLLTFKNGFKVLFWGGNISQSQKTLFEGIRPDVALMQYSNQNPHELAELARAIDPSVIIPHHHDLKMTLAEAQPKLEILSNLVSCPLLCPRNGEKLCF